VLLQSKASSSGLLLFGFEGGWLWSKVLSASRGKSVGCQRETFHSKVHFSCFASYRPHKHKIPSLADEAWGKEPYPETLAISGIQIWVWDLLTASQETWATTPSRLRNHHQINVLCQRGKIRIQ
jgi:hypothetical protein